ncbi:hypothetical protein D3C72_1804630 [compost metagenome]
MVHAKVDRRSVGLADRIRQGKGAGGVARPLGCAEIVQIAAGAAPLLEHDGDIQPAVRQRLVLRRRQAFRRKRRGVPVVVVADDRAHAFLEKPVGVFAQVLRRIDDFVHRCSPLSKGGGGVRHGRRTRVCRRQNAHVRTRGRGCTYPI